MRRQRERLKKEWEKLQKNILLSLKYETISWLARETFKQDSYCHDGRKYINIHEFADDNPSSGDANKIQSTIYIHEGYAEYKNSRANFVDSAPFCSLYLQKPNRKA